MKRSSLTVARLIIATAALAFGSAHAVVPYRVTDLGPGSALSINNVGQVLGSTGDQPMMYVFTPGSGATFLPQGFGAAGPSAPVAAVQPIIGGIAPGIAPTTVFSDEYRFIGV